MSTPAPAVRKLAEPLAVKKKLAADAKAGAILGRCICAVRRTRSIFQLSCRWRKGLNSAVRTKAAPRSRRVVVSQIFGLGSARVSRAGDGVTPSRTFVVFAL